tara:strand:+ start:3805 stop:4596 length:792 start_codon:yes stop_codon:yes gene_type:complete
MRLRIIKMTKPKVGFYGITGCAGCLLSAIFNEDDILPLTKIVDIVAFPFIKEKKDESGFDIVFMEGLVASKEDLRVLKEIREKTKVLVSLGACACTGGVPAFRNFIQHDDYQRLVFHKRMKLEDLEPSPIDKHVKVEYYLPGCPPDKNEILTFIKDLALGKKPKRYDKPVCFECRLNKNKCFLDKGELCLGPVTVGNCNSVCVNGGLVCWGCRGPTPDANFETLISLLHEKGIDIVNIRDRMKAFVGLKLPEEEKKNEQDYKT